MFTHEELPKDNKIRGTSYLLQNSLHIKDRNNGRQDSNFKLINQEDVTGKKRFEGEVVMSQQLKGLQDFNLKHEYDRVHQNKVIIPQSQQVLYNPILNKFNVVQPPPIKMESYSKLRENYFKLVTIPKGFNKKLGLFSHFTDNTISQQIMDKAYKDLALLKNSKERSSLEP